MVGLTTALAPLIFWASSPALPGQHILIGTTSRACCAQIRWPQMQDPDFVDANVTGVTDNGLTLEVPADFPAEHYTIRVKANPDDVWDDQRSTYSVNSPDPWFVYGDQGETASPGGYLRIVGNNLNYNEMGTSVSLYSDFQSYELKADPSNPTNNRFHAVFELSPDMREGRYQPMVNNAIADAKVCTYIDSDEPCRALLTVTAATPWPTDEFEVDCPQPGWGHDATDCIQKAVDLARDNGGGVVLLKRGQYFVTGAIVLGDKTVLRGAGKGLVSIMFGEDDEDSAPPAYLTGDGGQFGVEEVSIYVTAYANDVVNFPPNTDGSFLRNSLIRFNSYFSGNPDGSDSRGRSQPWAINAGCTVKIAGKNHVVENNDIYSSGDVISSRDNGDDIGLGWLRVSNNRLWNGGTTHWGISWKQSIFENNVATGVGQTSYGSNYPQYDSKEGNPSVQNIFHFNNSQTQVWGNDREMMTTDCCGGSYFGPALSEDQSTTLNLDHALDYPSPGSALCVLNGTNAGDCRRVTTMAADNMTLNVDYPFVAPLDDSSVVTVVPYQGHIMWVGNSYSDGGAVQLYGTGLECIMADNVFERTGGLISWARHIKAQSGWGTNHRNQFLDNVAIEGNHIYNYNTSPDSKDDPSKSAYFPGGSKTIEPWFFGSLTNDQGKPVEPNPNEDEIPFDDAFNRLIVFRNNVVKNNGGIVIRGTSANVLVEGNKIMDSDVGIHVNYTTTKGGIVVVGNEEPEGVPENYNPYSEEEERVTHVKV